MGSVAAMKLGAKIKSGAEFHGKSYYKERVLVAEGVEAMVPVKGTVKKVMEQAIGGIKSGMYYVGAKTIPELHKKAQFYQITPASLQESHPHDVFVTNAGASY
jgi:IMP dehydrogenase